MTHKINYRRLYFLALRTSLLFIIGFLIYEILSVTENKLNELYPNYKTFHYIKKTFFHFIFLFTADLIVLYLFIRMFNMKL